MKKIIIAVIAVALMATAAVPAFASRGHHYSRPEIKIDNDDVHVSTKGLVVSNSGLNKIEAGWFGEVEHASLTTGKAKAFSDVRNDVNYNEVKACGDCKADINIKNDDTYVSTRGLVLSNSGLNKIEAGHEVEHARLGTGGAFSNSYVENFVNTNIVK